MEDDLAEVGSELDFVRVARRSIHRYPELGHHEHRTATYVEHALQQMGLKPFRAAPTSIAVVIGPTDVSPAIGFRADMDAIRVAEATDVAYASQHPGVMHACGHDAH